MFKRNLLMTMLLAAVALGSQAQDVMTLSLDDCIKIALNDNPSIKINEMELERVDYAKKEVLG